MKIRQTAAKRRTLTLFFGLLSIACHSACAGGGPFGIDHYVKPQDNGIWTRGNQQFVFSSVMLTVAGGALWEGSDTRLGQTFWRSVDSVGIGAFTSEGMKIAFSRDRPYQSRDPNEWFKGGGHQSFPSGEVMEITTAVTPFVAEYAHDYPAVYALELLPIYDAIARVRIGDHWQSDVVASLIIGTGIGIYSHQRTSPISVGILPHGLTVGWKTSF